MALIPENEVKSEYLLRRGTTGTPNYGDLKNMELDIQTLVDAVNSVTTVAGVPASATQDGYLLAVDWVTFNNKQNALGFTPENVANKDTDGTLAANSDTKYPSQKAVKTYADTKLIGNAPIVGATKTKITYDTKGLVTSGADATTADIADSTNKRYQTDNQQSRNDATSSIQTQLDSKQASLGYTPEDVANKSTNVNTDQASDTKYPSVKAVYEWVFSLFQTLANKDATGGYAGLTLFKINFKNAANTFTSFFTNSNTAARTYTFQDRNGTIADDTDLGLKANLASPTFTGTPAAPTPAASDNSTKIATTAYVDAADNLNAKILGFTASGTDTYAFTGAFPAAYTTNESFRVIFTNANTGAATLNRNSLGAKAIKKNVSAALISGDILAGKAYVLVYDGTNYQLLNPDTRFPTILKMTTGDQTTTSSAAGNITDLVFPVLANSTYVIDGFFRIACNNTGGVKFALVVPASTTFVVEMTGWATSSVTAQFSALVTSGTLQGTAFNRVNSNTPVRFQAIVVVAATAGNIQVQFASGTNTETSTIFQDTTALSITKVA